jgi:hypothetical protein
MPSWIDEGRDGRRDREEAMNRKWTMRAGVLAACLLMSGCLVGETTHTFYLDPSGGLTWSILERNIRSDLDDPAERAVEEQGYIDRAWDGRHAVARALEHLRPLEVSWDVLRGTTPFSVLTEARYESPAHLAWAIMDGLGARGDAWMESTGDKTRFVLILDADQECDDEDAFDTLGALVADDLGDYRIHLTAGRFVDAVGFDIQGQDNIAVPEEVEEDEACELVYSLTWTTAAAE